MFNKKTVISTRFWSVFVASIFSVTSEYLLVLTDNVVAGQIVGDDAVASMTLMFPIFSFMLFIAYIISDGLVMMASYARGRNDREEVDRLFSLGIIFSIVCSLIFFTALYFLREEILAFWDVSPDLKFFAGEYYSGLIFCSLVLFLSMFNYTLFYSEGMERACVIGAGSSFAVNVILDIVLCQNFGVFGIGIATTLGNFTSVVIQTYYLTRVQKFLHFKWYWNWKKIWRGVVFSFYHSIDTLCLSILPIIVSMQVIEYFGDEKLIIVTAAINLLTLILAFYTGLIDCLQPMICQYHAENNLHSIIKTMRLGMATAILSTLIMILAGMIFANFLPLMFGVTDTKLADETAVAMRYLLPLTIFLGATQILGNYYIYIEKMNYGVTLKIFLMLILPFCATILSRYLAINIWGQFTMNMFMFSISFSFFAAFLLNYLYLKTRNGLLMIDKENLNRQISYDINTTFEEVMALTRQIDEDLTRRGVDEKTKNKITLCIEEFGLHAVERAGKNIFQLEFSILLDEKITLIIRDNGEIYDIIKTAQEKNFSFREFFIEGVTSKFILRKYTASGDENRVTLQF